MIYTIMENVLEFLEENMKKRGWSQADLARKSGLDTSLVSNIFSGRRNIGVTSTTANSRKLSSKSCSLLPRSRNRGKRKQLRRTKIYGAKLSQKPEISLIHNNIVQALFSIII